MKLIASPHFPEKRIGYLGMMLLLTEDSDVLMLATNALKNDLNHENKLVAGLALCAIGNLATADMSRDLIPEVDKQLKSSQPYLRKKACLAMARCLTKCPDLVEDFVDRIISLLKDRSYGVLFTAVQLMIEVLVADQKNREKEGIVDGESATKLSFLRAVPTIVKLLRNVIGGGYSNETDLAGSSDPFLQVQILTLLRLLGIGNTKASEDMNDVLAQVASGAESANNAGNAVLYECVQTILAIESEPSLRVTAVNVLGRFLLNKDNNIRYVALNTLSRSFVEQHESGKFFEETDKGSNTGSTALLRHRAVILDCLKDADITIRQRALELIYYLVNIENVKDMIAELLNYLVLCPREHRSDICTRILRVVDKFSPDDRWRVDTLITMLTIAGRECSRNVCNSIVVYITRSSEDIHAYAVHRLLNAIRDDDGSQKGLLLVGVWCIGEYGDLLLQPYSYVEGTGVDFNTAKESANSNVSFSALNPMSVVSTVEALVTRPSCPEEVKHRALTCFTKLWNRFSSLGHTEVLPKLQRLSNLYDASSSLELQLRSCEYNALINTMNGKKTMKKATDDLFALNDGDATVSDAVKIAAKEALARMPVVELNLLNRKRVPDISENLFDDGDVSSTSDAPKGSAGNDLLDLAVLLSTPQTQVTPAPTTNISTVSASAKSSERSDKDLLADIFSVVNTPVPSVPATIAPSPFDAFNSIGQYPMNSMQMMTTSHTMPTSIPPIPTSMPPMPTSTPQIPVLAQSMPGSLPLMPVSFPPVPVGRSPEPSRFDAFGIPPNSMPQPSQFSPPIVNPVPTGISNFNAFGNTSIQESNSRLGPSYDAPHASVKVPGFSYSGLTIDFECTKPDGTNVDKSTITMKFSNSSDMPIYGLNVQCAVPKYVTMEMKPPSSTTVPVSVGTDGNQVTQVIHVTNTMVGAKNLMLKLKVGFTSKGEKIEHMATCSNFPMGF
jgi:AP-1 complex subunit gamma-1